MNGEDALKIELRVPHRMQGSPSSFRKTSANKKAQKNILENKKGSQLLIQKFFNLKESLLSRNPLRKILPIIKKTQNRNFMWIIFFVIRFVKILKDKTFISKYDKLNLKHFHLISDNSKLPGDSNHIFKKSTTLKNTTFEFLRKKSSVSTKIKDRLLEKTKNCVEEIYSFFEIIGSYLPVFESDRPFRFSFDILMLFYLILLIANIMLKFGFHLSESNYIYSIWIIFEIIPPWLFLLEFFLNLNTSFYSKGIFVCERSKIISHYFTEYFFLDLITVVPLFLRWTEYGDFLQVLVVLRLKNLDNILKRLEEYLQLKGKKEGLYQLFKLSFSLLFLAHICACVWHYVGIWEISSGITHNWINEKNIENEEWSIRYIYSFYYSIVTMMTVGYGDITPNNFIECLFSITFIIYGCGVFAYSINNIGNIFKEMYQDDKDFKKKIKILSDFMNKRGISKFLQIKIKKYLEYMFEESKMNYQETLLLTQSLSQSLKEECYNELYGKLLKKHHVLSQFSDLFQRKLTHCFQELTYAPDDIVQNHENDEKIIYFILKGEFKYLLNASEQKKQNFRKTKFTLIKAGDSFGDIGFFTNENKIHYAKSLSVAHIALIKRNDFINLLSEYPEDYEKFCYIRDKILFSKDILPLNLRCFSCGSSEHLIGTCPLIHYVPDIKLILKRYLCSENQERNEKIRKNYRYNALNHIKNIQYKASCFYKSPNNGSKTNRDSGFSEENESASYLEDFEEKDNENYGQIGEENNSAISLKSIKKGEEMKKDDFIDEYETPALRMIKNRSKSYNEKAEKFRNLKIIPNKNLRKYTSSEENNPLKTLEDLAKTPNKIIKSFEKFGLQTNESIEPKFQGNQLLLYGSPRLVNSYLKKIDPVIIDSPGERFAINTGNPESNIFKESDKISNNFIEIEANFNSTIENLDKIKSFKFYFAENNIEEVLKKARKKLSPTKLKRKSNSKSRSPNKKSIFNKK